MEPTATGPEIFKQDSTGKTRTWRYLVGTDGTNWGWAAVSGTLGGKLVTSGWRVVEAKNVGRANETTPQEQALAEAKASMEKKLERGYFYDMDNIDKFDKFKPMLASKYEDAKIDWDGTVFSQPKLDGIRCIARKDGLWTRQGKPITSVPHIMEALRPYFEEYPTLILDGELYNHDLKDNFNKITSLVRKQKPTSEDLEETAKLVQYHVYDLYSADPFDIRNKALQQLLGSGKTPASIVLVRTDLILSAEETDALYGEYLEQGYEGQMLRIGSSGYENKRSKNLIKRKEFLTDEFRVVSMEEGLGNWAGYIKRFIIDLGNGQTCGAGVRGSQEQLKALYEEGKTPDWVTLRYFTPTPDGVPRFPVVVDYGFGERED